MLLSHAFELGIDNGTWWGGHSGVEPADPRSIEMHLLLEGITSEANAKQWLLQHAAPNGVVAKFVHADNAPAQVKGLPEGADTEMKCTAAIADDA